MCVWELIQNRTLKIWEHLFKKRKDQGLNPTQDFFKDSVSVVLLGSEIWIVERESK